MRRETKTGKGLKHERLKRIEGKIEMDTQEEKMGTDKKAGEEQVRIANS